MRLESDNKVTAECHFKVMRVDKASLRRRTAVVKVKKCRQPRQSMTSTCLPVSLGEVWPWHWIRLEYIPSSKVAGIKEFFLLPPPTGFSHLKLSHSCESINARALQTPPLSRRPFSQHHRQSSRPPRSASRTNLLDMLNTILVTRWDTKSPSLQLTGRKSVARR